MILHKPKLTVARELVEYLDKTLCLAAMYCSPVRGRLSKLTSRCANRSLEKCIERTLICLNPQKRADESRASQSEQDNVQAVLQEADHPSYWVSASKDGNRESHYRGDNID